MLYQETDPDPAKGFNDPAKGRAIAEQFIGQDADVLFQVAGLTGQGVLEAVCDADLNGIGVDVDQAVSLPNLAPCIVTSAEKKLVDTVKASSSSVASDTFVAGHRRLQRGLRRRRPSACAPYHDNAAKITPEIQAPDRRRLGRASSTDRSIRARRSSAR